ncbi:MAG TPA: PAS domain S-box protein [Sneathiellales bacterium]|nr:PAS domain S-box protein [Sneathiellales bacterium]
MDHIKDAVISTDLNGMVRSWNRGAQLHFGYTAAQAIGQHISLILADGPGHFSFDDSFVSKLVSDECSRQEITFLRKSSLHITCQTSFFPVNDDRGAPVWIVMYAWSNFLEREAERHRQLSSTLFNTSADGMMITDQHCQIEAVNPAFEKLTGYSAREILGKIPDILASGQHSSEFFKSTWNSLQRNGCWQGNVWNRHKNGELYVQHPTITAMAESEGDVAKYVAVFNEGVGETRP